VVAGSVYGQFLPGKIDPGVAAGGSIRQSDVRVQLQGEFRDVGRGAVFGELGCRCGEQLPVAGVVPRMITGYFVGELISLKGLRMGKPIALPVLRS
jgi:hypothetical protein